MNKFRTIRDIDHLQGVRVLVRVDFNVPIKDGKVTDAIRIRSTMPTIEYLSSRGAKVILMSHIEVLEGEKATLEPAARELSKLGCQALFVKDMRVAVETVEHKLADGQCLLLENLRKYPGEKANDIKFAKELASLADIYVNDAFSVSHREHASVVSVPTFLPSYAGLQLEREVANLSKAFDPERPFLFILGGAKFSTKLPLLDKFLKIADEIFVGGALANDLFKTKGYDMGASRVSDDKFDLTPFVNSPKLLLPLDVVTDKGENKDPDKLTKDDKALDAGSKTMDLLKKRVDAAKFILWNGPLGLYEDGYREPTLDLARTIGDATSRGTTTIVGGGDTLAAIATLGIEDKFTFVSTAGGAMLDFLTQGTLPGIEALEKSNNNG